MAEDGGEVHGRSIMSLPLSTTNTYFDGNRVRANTANTVRNATVFLLELNLLMKETNSKVFFD